MKNWRSRKMLKALPPKKAGTISGEKVLSQPSIRKRMNGRDQRHLAREHHRGEQHAGSSSVAAREAQAGEAEGHQRR